MVFVLQLQLALTLAWVGSRVLERTMASPRARLRTGRALLALALVSPLLVQRLPRPWTPPAALRTAVETGGPVAQVHLDQLGLAASPVDLSLAPLEPALDLMAVLPWLLVVAGALRLARAVGRLHRVVAAAPAAGSFEDVSVRIHPTAPGPFAALVPGRRVIVLDTATHTSAARGLALRHERQHHAQGDPVLAWLWLFLRGSLGWNPAVGMWAAEMAELEEQACDAAVVARPGVSPRAYGAMLLAHATSAPPPVGAAGLAPRSPLHQRLLALARPRTARPFSAALSVVMGAGLVLAGSVGLRSLAADWRVDDRAIRQAIERSATATADPVVETELRRMLSDHAAFYRRGLDRRPAWSPLVDGALEDAELPAFLAAIPLVESGYSNWGAPGGAESQSAAPGRIPGRGLWMFIPATARSYGLQVDDDRDERLAPRAETAAAVALLRDLHTEFGDWGLALAAYNQGSAAVRAAIAAGGTRDVLRLIEQGLLNPYAASVLAAAVLLESPELLP